MTSMRHLTEAQLLDAAEAIESRAELAPGADDSADVHLRACAECRQQVDDLRRIVGAVQSVDVPEPSPLFWEHLSARIRETVAAEPSPVAEPRPWWPRWAARPWAIEFGVAAVVALLVAVGVWQRPGSPTGGVSAPTELAEVAPVVAEVLPADADDPSLTLLVDLAGGLEWDEAMAAGISLDAGATDAVVAGLSLDERVELHRLLTEALNAL